MALVGLEKLYYAKVTKDDATGVTFGTPIYLPGVKEIKISPKVNTEKLYAENQLWEQSTALDSVEVSINLADLTNAELADLLGHELATEGGIIANADDFPPYIALLHKANKSNGKARYSILYKGKLELPEDSAKTKEGKTDFQTPEVKATFQPLQNNGRWKYQVDSDDSTCPADIDTTFFTNVINPGSDTAAPTVTALPADAATGVSSSANVVFTFNKAIQPSTVISSNFLLMKADGTDVPTTLSIGTNDTVVTLDPISELSAGSYIAIATTNVKSIAGISIVANCVVNFTV